MQATIQTYHRTESVNDWCDLVEGANEWIALLRPASRVARVGVTSAELAEIKEWNPGQPARRAGIEIRHRIGAGTRPLLARAGSAANEARFADEATRLLPLRAVGIPLRLRVAAAAKLLVEAFAHPLTPSYLGIDLERQAVVVERAMPASNRRRPT